MENSIVFFENSKGSIVYNNKLYYISDKLFDEIKSKVNFYLSRTTSDNYLELSNYLENVFRDKKEKFEIDLILNNN